MNGACTRIISAPAKLIAKVTQLVRVNLTWSASVDLVRKPVSYEVFSSLDGKTFVSKGITKSLTMTLPGSIKKAVNYYKVQAFDAAGNRSLDSAAVTAVTGK